MKKKSLITPEKRIFSLILALVASKEGLTKEQLLASVYGYSDLYKIGEDNSSLERKFERDKDLLRSLGIPLETQDSPEEPGNNRRTRYFISKSSLQMPEDIKFSNTDLMLLRAAALAWADTSISEQAKHSIMKLESLSAGLDVSLLGIAPRANLNERGSNSLLLAIQNKNSVKFKYAKPGDSSPELRKVTPYLLHRADNRWHLVAFDHDREDFRVFLLARITGTVKEIAALDTVDRSEQAHAVVDELKELQNSRSVEITARSNSALAARLKNRSVKNIQQGGSVRFFINTLDSDAFAEELVAYMNDVLEIHPVSFKQIFLSKLQIMADLHRGGTNEK